MTPLVVIVALVSACGGGGGTEKKDCVFSAMFNNINSQSGLDLFDDSDRAQMKQYDAVYLAALKKCGLTGSDTEIEREANKIMEN